jgi:hypothetical protein
MHIPVFFTLRAIFPVLMTTRLDARRRRPFSHCNAGAARFRRQFPYRCPTAGIRKQDQSCSRLFLQQSSDTARRWRCHRRKDAFQPTAATFIQGMQQLGGCVAAPRTKNRELARSWKRATRVADCRQRAVIPPGYQQLRRLKEQTHRSQQEQPANEPEQYPVRQVFQDCTLLFFCGRVLPSPWVFPVPLENSL